MSESLNMTTSRMNVLKVSTSQLNLKAVLINGQSFRWRNIEKNYYGVVDGLLYYLRRLDDETIEWMCLGRTPSAANVDASHKLYEYFQLDVPLDKLWDIWCTEDAFMTDLRSIKELQGIRILKQDFFETLVAFICSSNNNIRRISKMVNSLAMMYGDMIKVDCPLPDTCVLHRFPELEFAFPTITRLADDKNLAEVLRKQLFGYRARSVSEAVRQLASKEIVCFDDVQRLPYEDIRKLLLSFTGVGPKVAECVALMSLGQNQSVPVDRHIFEITKKHFLPSLSQCKLTNSLSHRIMEFHKEKFGAYAGWAQAVLFNYQLEDQFVNGSSQKKRSQSKNEVHATKNVTKRKKVKK